MAVEYMSYAQQQLLQMKRLGNKLFRSDFESFQTMFGGTERCHEHHRQRSAGFDVARQFKTGTVRQADVQNYQIPKSFAQLF